MEDDLSKEKRSLLGKICMEKIINKKLIRTTMRKIWKLHKLAIFKEVGKNTFATTFTNEADKLKVKDDKP